MCQASTMHGLYGFPLLLRCNSLTSARNPHASPPAASVACALPEVMCTGVVWRCSNNRTMSTTMLHICHLLEVAACSFALLLPESTTRVRNISFEPWYDSVVAENAQAMWFALGLCSA